MVGSIHSMPICSHINFYSLTLKVHFDLLWPLWPLFGLFDNFFQLLNIHFNISNRGASSEVTIILVVSINKFRFLGPENGRLLNRERIVCCGVQKLMTRLIIIGAQRSCCCHLHISCINIWSELLKS